MARMLDQESTRIADQAGRDVVDAIAAVPTGRNDKPVEPVVIESVEIKG